jgi:hypothetical protein
MEVTNALKRLRDDLKEWTTNNMLSLKAYVDKTKFSGSYEDLTDKPNIPSMEGLATDQDLQQLEELVLERTRSKFEPAEDDIPRVYFSGDLLPVTKDYKMLKMKYVSKTMSFDSYIKIKCQGTSSMAYDKKNFSIRTYSDEARETKLKLSFRNWGEQYKFVLKANYIDLSHARNVVSSKLWADCVKTRSNFDTLPELLKEAPNLGAIDGFFVKVYHEGVYQGRYTFNIPKDPWMTNMDEDNEQHCLLCSENYDSGCFNAPAIIDETDWTDEIHDVVPEAIKTRWNEVIDFVRFSSDDEFRNNLHNYFDVESLIDYYCFQDLICGLDSMGKNQVYITYDGNLWLATAYDMDSTWGLYWDGQYLVSPAYRMQEDYETGKNGTSNLLYARLEKLFVQEIYDRYHILRSGPMSITNVVEKFENFVSACTPELIEEDFDNFPYIPGKEFNNIKQIRSYAVNRFNYCDDRMNAMVIDNIDANVLYSIPQQTTFNGSNHIDTGIKLFDTAKDWTLVLHGYTPDLDYQNPNTAIVHCMYEGDDGNYPGLCLQFVYEETGQFLIMSEGNIFPDNPIKSETFKVALICEKGIITQLKMIDKFGVESYKRTRGNYVPVNKNLIIGAYQDEGGNFDRHWNGVMYSCILYDRALTGGEVNYVFNNLPRPNLVLVENYTPNGRSFQHEAEIDWSKQELYVTADLSTCQNSTECTLSFGNNIVSWSGQNVHFYYTKSSGRMLVQCMQGGAAQNIECTIQGQLEVRFNSEGLYINGTLYRKEDYAAFMNIYNLAKVQVGSAEGATRSTASNYYIAVRDKQ